MATYYDNNTFITSYSHHYVALFGYVQTGCGLMYVQYFVPMYYLQYHPQSFVPCDDSWTMINPHQEEEEGTEGDYYNQYVMPCDDSWILNSHEDEEEEDEPTLSEEELRQFDLIDEEVVVYDTTRDDDGLSEETVTKHLNTRNHEHPINAHNICVVCQECLLQDDEKIATLDCGHDFHAGCIKSWLMLKNRCPLCKATGIQL